MERKLIMAYKLIMACKSIMACKLIMTCKLSMVSKLMACKYFAISSESGGSSEIGHKCCEYTVYE